VRAARARDKTVRDQLRVRFIKTLGMMIEVLVVTRPQKSRGNKSRSVVVVGIMLAWSSFGGCQCSLQNKGNPYKLAPVKVASFLRKRRPALRTGKRVRRARTTNSAKAGRKERHYHYYIFFGNADHDWHLYCNIANAHYSTMKPRRLFVQQLQRATLSQRPRPRCSSHLLAAAALSRTTGPQRQREYATVSAADLQFGQPVHETHPHLLRAGESKQPFRFFAN
jgi:hypothetical protein